MSLVATGLGVAGRLAGIDLALRRGEIAAICGPNGAGKSTLLQALAGLLPGDAGQVALTGDDLERLSPRARARRIGYLPQHAEIAWDVTVRSIIELGRMPHRDRDPAPVDAAIAALDLGAFEQRRAQALSGGEKARILLARVLAGEPEWILADEPLAALDLGHQYELLRHLRDAAARGVGVVLVLHDLALAMNHADRVVVLDAGRLVADASPDEALRAEMVGRVWKIDMKWLGSAGARALVRV